MNNWKPFLPEEISIMAANTKPLEDTSERKCSSCGETSIRRYYRERGTRGTTWYWCHNCGKFAHFSVAPRSKEYEFGDPISDVPEKGSYKWYEYLDSLWDKGILPQKFTRK
jgi:predicted RNA-binding Zn-ribbon protein involved in translation (DUF1610 family)